MAHLRADQFFLHAGGAKSLNDLAQTRLFDAYQGDPDTLAQFDGGTFNIVVHPEKTSPVGQKNGFNNVFNRFDEAGFTKSWAGDRMNEYPTIKAMVGCSTTWGDKSYWALGSGNTLLAPSNTKINANYSRPVGPGTLPSEIRRRLLYYTANNVAFPWWGGDTPETLVKNIYRTLFRRFHPNRFILSLNWEMGGDWFSWSPMTGADQPALRNWFNTYKANLHTAPTTGQYGNSAVYITAWQNVVTWIREVQQENLGAGYYSYTKPAAGTSHCKFACMTSLEDWNTGWLVDAYPGNGYVDYIGTDQYVNLYKNPNRAFPYVEARMNNMFNFCVGRGKQLSWHEVGWVPGHPDTTTEADYITNTASLKSYLSNLAGWLYSRPTTGPGSIGSIGWWSVYGSNNNFKLPIGYYNWVSCPSPPTVPSYTKYAQDQLHDRFVQLFLKGNTGLFEGQWTDDNTPVDVNVGPIVDAGTDQNLDTGTTSTTLTATASDDGLPASPGAISYSWTLVSGPNTPTIVSPTAASTSVTGMIDGIYTFRCTVTDGELSSRDTLLVVIGTSEPENPDPETDVGGGEGVITEEIGWGPLVLFTSTLDTGRRLRCAFDSDLDQEGGRPVRIGRS